MNNRLLSTLIFVCCCSVHGQDVTAPQLTNFTVTPTVFDTTNVDVTISFCLSGTDDVAGIGDGFVRADSAVSMPISGFFGVSLNFQGALSGSQCGSAVVPKGSKAEIQPIVVGFKDRVGNTRLVGNPSSPYCGLYGGCENLCALGFPCTVENKVLTVPTTTSIGTISPSPATVARAYKVSAPTERGSEAGCCGSAGYEESDRPGDDLSNPYGDVLDEMKCSILIVHRTRISSTRSLCSGAPRHNYFAWESLPGPAPILERKPSRDLRGTLTRCGEYLAKVR